ncbi:hypothetical protein BLNAU_7537 [Blattamonas nauphoetae]|uniref:Uncharacterized protein n=1 Tax=Blattamonas nauphoetae TaxID=2049346 RepID=A0ABQ9Y1P0_9EUKA|nr:hypothetical protein BLNAU_7537 [Blattamonas nauphoetae]
MTVIDTKIDASTDYQCPDCSAFLNWDYKRFDSELKRAVVFQSLVATVKIHPVLDDSLERKAVRFLEHVHPDRIESTDAFLNRFTSLLDNSWPEFVQSIVVLISSPSKAIAAAAMKILDTLFWNSSANNRLTLVSADLIPQLVINLNPLSLSFSDAFDIHTCLMTSILRSLWLATPESLARLEIEDENEQLAVRETVFQQVLIPSERYTCHLCMNRFSIIDGELSRYFLLILGLILRISPFHQPTMDVVLQMPVVLTSPSCLAFFEDEVSIWNFLREIYNAQWEWNKRKGGKRQIWNNVHRMLRMEGIEDVIEEKLQNHKNEYGRAIVEKSIRWNNFLGMDLPWR